MNISFKTSIIATLAVAISGGGLLALFYFSEGDSGAYAELALGEVRGGAVSRFVLPPDEIIVSSRRAGAGLEEDVAILTETPSRGQRVVRVIREQAVLFEQAVSTEFRSIAWDQENGRFSVRSAGAGESFHLVPSGGGYTLIPAR